MKTVGGGLQYKGVICFSAIDWNFLKQRTHYLMAGLAAEGLKVLFIENTGVRSPKIRDFSRVINRLKNAAGQIQEEEIPDGIEIFSPLAVPLPYNRLAINYNKSYISYRVKQYLRANNLKPSEVIFWTCLATPVVLELMQSHSWGVTVYDVVSDPKFIEPRLEPFERLITGQADYTFFASATLYDEYNMSTKNPVLFKDGFNLKLLREEESTSEIEELPHPRFVYIGGINRKIQVDALAALAGHFRGGSIILIGPRSEDFKIPTYKNIYIYPSRRRYGEIARFLRTADVGLIPYIPDKYSGPMHPAKINEYLIYGLPVVATATPELTRLADLWGEGFFYLNDSPNKIVTMAEKALSEDNEVLRKKRQALTKKNSWDKRVQELIKVLARGYGIIKVEIPFVENDKKKDKYENASTIKTIPYFY